MWQHTRKLSAHPNYGNLQLWLSAHRHRNGNLLADRSEAMFPMDKSEATCNTDYGCLEGVRKASSATPVPGMLGPHPVTNPLMTPGPSPVSPARRALRCIRATTWPGPDPGATSDTPSIASHPLDSSQLLALDRVGNKMVIPTAHVLVSMREWSMS